MSVLMLILARWELEQIFFLLTLIFDWCITENWRIEVGCFLLMSVSVWYLIFCFCRWYLSRSMPDRKKYRQLHYVVFVCRAWNVSFVFSCSFQFLFQRCWLQVIKLDSDSFVPGNADSPASLVMLVFCITKNRLTAYQLNAIE